MVDEIPKDAVDKLVIKLKTDSEGGGYHLNPDIEFVSELASGLLFNEKRYGYQSCPCRLSTGQLAQDRDIICPCNYRDQDVIEWGGCYCGLFVSQEVLEGTKKLSSVPERRKPLEERISEKNIYSDSNIDMTGLKYPVYRCSVCGYLCARETPPEICPICKVKKDRFERFI